MALLCHVRGITRLRKLPRVLVRPFSSKEGDDSYKNLKRGSAAGSYRNPIEVLKKEFRMKMSGQIVDDVLPVPRETDVAVIGGGAIGLATAYFLKADNPRGINVTVIERDPTYQQCSTVLSVGGIRQQFSLKENVEMSLFAAEFFRNIKEHLSVLDLDPPDIQYNPGGYLLLASDKGQEIMENNHKTQIESGAKVVLMNPEELKAKFPYLNTEGVAMGSYGLENEGWFDPWLLLAALKAKCSNLGVKFVKGEVVDFTFKEGPPLLMETGERKKRHLLENMLVKAEDNIVYPLTFMACVNAAGAWSGNIARMAGIGTGDGVLAIPLPVEPRKRFVYMFHCPDGPGLDMPLTIDPTCVYARREGLGGHYICGVSPKEDSEEPDCTNLDVDYDWFEERIWPTLANRIPAFEKLKLSNVEDEEELDAEMYYHRHVAPVLANRLPSFQNSELKSAWAGYYDYNYFDENLIIGNHPYHRNMFFATGCSGHGIQQAVAIGRGISELIFDNEYTTIDLEQFSFDRVLDGQRVHEVNCI